MASTTECVFCGRPWEPGVVRHSNEHIWSQWLRDHAGELPADRWSAALGLKMDPGGHSFTELPYVSTRDKASVLNLVTREVCKDCNGQLGRDLEPKVKPVFLAMAHAAEHGSTTELSVEDAQTLGRWAQKMATTNELTATPPRVVTPQMGRAILDGGTIRGAVVWAARHPADYMLLTAVAHSAIGATEQPEPGEYLRFAVITVITFHYLSLLVFIPGPGGPHVAPTPPPYPPDKWTLIWPVRRQPEYPPLATIDARELERAVTDYSRWLRTPRAMMNINPSLVPSRVIQRN
jgi:hypothetical protein